MAVGPWEGRVSWLWIVPAVVALLAIVSAYLAWGGPKRWSQSATDFFRKRGEHFSSMLGNATLWIGIAFCGAAGETMDKWISLRDQAIIAGKTWQPDWFDKAAAAFFVGGAVFIALRNFRDGSYKTYRDKKKESETAWAQRQLQEAQTTITPGTEGPPE